jgi:crotonobetainyl-CoA:carnitine CoA-transferase CaiB-like acyl-CoA transferase
MALLVRGQTGQGQLVDTALLDGQVAWLTHVAGAYFATGQRPQKLGNAHATIVPYQPFRARDKFVIVAVGSERLWQRFCQALAIEETIGSDPRFTTNADRLKHREALIPRLEQIFATQDAESWLRKLRAADIPCGPINEVDEALTDPQILARDMIVEQMHSTVGPVRSVGNPVHLSETPVSYRLPPPALGQHTVDVLAALGYTPEGIASLRNRRAI